MIKTIQHTKIDNVIGDTAFLRDEKGETTEVEFYVIPLNLRRRGAFITITKTISPGQKVFTYTRGKEFKEECTCPQTCDCQNPPPKGWDGKDGAWAISESCPVHNDRPAFNPDCPIHGNE